MSIGKGRGPHTAMLLARPRNTLDRGKVESPVQHPTEDEVQRLDPHGYWRIDLVLAQPLNPTNNAVVA